MADLSNLTNAMVDGVANGLSASNEKIYELTYGKSESYRIFM